MTIRIENGEVTLDGTVASRREKRRAEDAVERVSGVRHVQNNLRVQDSVRQSRNQSQTSGSSALAGPDSTGATTARTTEQTA